MSNVRWLCRACIFLFLLCVLCDELSSCQQREWGGDHVGKSIPEFATADECLFCHRNTIGSSWASNRHNLTMRQPVAMESGLAVLKADPKCRPLADEVSLILGGKKQQRFLKPNGAYGKVDLLSAKWTPSRDGVAGKLTSTEQPHWDKTRFADGCAGCHATAVATKTRAFASTALDCFTCHGDAPSDHPKDTSLVLFSRKRKDPARVMTSICAQCHIRTGKSKSTGLPYPNQLVPGDNLFRDFQVDLSPEAIEKLNPADRHILLNVRDVVVMGKEDVTCLSCHEVHKSSTRKHHLAQVDASCTLCHPATGSKKIHLSYEVHSTVCDY